MSWGDSTPEDEELIAQLGQATRLIVVAPFPPGVARGNQTTADRMAWRLQQAGLNVRLVSLDELEAAAHDATARAELRARSEDPHTIWIGVHVRHFQNALELVQFDLHAPRAKRAGLLLVIGGNDVYEQLGTDRDGQLFAGAEPLASAHLVRAVDAIAVASKHQMEAVQAHHPRATVIAVPRYPEVGFAALPLDPKTLAAFVRPPETGVKAPIITWCGMFRTVKRPEWIAPILRGVRATHPTVRLLLAGPTPAPDDPLEAELHALGGVLRCPPFPAGRLGAMGTLLHSTDIALNTSRSEGTANFLLEAMHESVPVIATDCPGTAAWASEAALLYHTVDQAIAHLVRLLDKPNERAIAAHAGARYVRSHASPEAERYALLQACVAASASALA